MNLDKYIDELVSEAMALVVKQARAMAEDIERQDLPTTGPSALRMFANCIERGSRHD